MKPSGWISFVVIVQLLYALLLIVIPIYLPGSRRWMGRDLRISGTGMSRDCGTHRLVGSAQRKIMGWSVALFADLVMFGILIYSLIIDDSWHNVDREMVGMRVLAATISAAFFIPAVRRSYWQCVGTQPVLSS